MKDLIVLRIYYPLTVVFRL